MWRRLAGVFLFSQLPPLLSASGVPIGVLTALATQTRHYKAPVKLSYLEPVNCTLSFSEDIIAFSPQHLTKAATTVISNFVQVAPSEYDFQVSSMRDGNVTLSIAPGAIQSIGGVYNNQTTAAFDFEFYAFPPSVKLRLDGYEAQSTRKERNIAYLLFNTTTQYDETQWLNESLVSISPEIKITEFQQVNDKMYRFKFFIPSNDSYPAVECVAPGVGAQSSNHTIFACSKCERPEMCMSQTLYPPKGVSYLEFPLSIVLKPVPALGLPSTTLPIVYDTLWGYVKMDAPEYAKEPFYVTITWSEPLSDLVAVLPTFDATGPPVDQELLKRNLTILNSTSFRLLVAPKRTGTLTIHMNGDQASIDLAGNANDFYRIPASRTSVTKMVVYSSGPPLPGAMEFRYERPRLVGEYPVATVASDFQAPISPSLTVFWGNFRTATRYDTWVRWGQNLSTAEVLGLTSVQQWTFDQFPAMLGVEYQVYVRAFNYFGQNTTVVRTFLHPQFELIGDGTLSMMMLPKMLSPTQKTVPVNVLVPKDSFLSLNPLKILKFRAANRSAGDQDPCRENSRVLRCTQLNFHMEVPATQFVIFKRPIRLQFIFGREGWQDTYFRPRLRYWETHDDLWRDAESTCPQEQVYDRWNKLHRIYEVSVCHLSQFAVFEVFEPAAPTIPPPVPGRPESYAGATFFIVLAGCVVGGALICCVCYFGCARRRRANIVYKDMGIKSVNDRLPSRRLGSSGCHFAQVLASPEVPEAEQDYRPRHMRPLPPVRAEQSQLLESLPPPPDSGQLLALPPPGPAEDTPLSSEPPSPIRPPMHAPDAMHAPEAEEPQGAFMTDVEDFHREPTTPTGTEVPRVLSFSSSASDPEMEPLGGGNGGFGVVPTGNGPTVQSLPNAMERSNSRESN